VASLIEHQALEFDELVDAIGTAPAQHGVDARTSSRGEKGLVT